MRNLLSNDDIRRVANGLSFACLAGLIAGGIMQPDLDQHDANGPQMVMGVGGPRKVFAAFDPGVARYGGEVPEHVIGTDWTRPRTVPAATYDVEAAGEETVAYRDEPVEVAWTSYAEEPRTEPVYPSARGNTHYEADLPPAPPPPSDLDEEVVISG
jgi:hypothetical protein